MRVVLRRRMTAMYRAFLQQARGTASIMSHRLKTEVPMRKMIFMAVASFIWKKYMARKAGKRAAYGRY